MRSRAGKTTVPQSAELPEMTREQARESPKSADRAIQDEILVRTPCNRT